MLEKYLNKKKYDFIFVLKWTFISFLIFHGFFFSSRFANEDYLHDFYKSGAVILSGRFFGGITDIMNPWTIGVISAFVFSIALFCLMDMLYIKSPFMRILSIFIMVSFPTLATGFGYLFMVQVYSFAFLFSVLAVYLTDNFKYGYILGAFFIMLSLGSYQSYIGVSMALSVLLVVREWRLKPDNTKDKFLKFVIMGVIGIALYMFIIKILYPILNLQLNTYKGLNNMGSINIYDIPYLFIRTYKSVIYFIFGKRFFSASLIHVFANIVLSCFIIYYVFRYFVKRGKKTSDIFIFFILMGLPLCFNIVDFIAPESQATPLTVYALSLAYIFAISLYEWDRIEFTKDIKRTKMDKYKYLVFVISIVVVIYSNFIISSTYYLKIEQSYESSVLTYNRLYSRIEAIDGYSMDMQIAIISSNRSEYVKYGRIYPEIIEDTGIWQKYIGFNDLASTRISYATNRAVRFMNNVLDVGVIGAEPKQIDKIVMSKEYKDMGVYPSDDGIKIIDGILVVNFEDNLYK